MKFLKNSIKNRFIFVVIIVVLITAFISIFNAFQTIKGLTALFLKTFEKNLLEEKKAELKTAIQIGENTIQTFYHTSLKVIVEREIKRKLKYFSDLILNIIKTYYSQNKNRIPENQLKAEVLNLIKKANYGKIGYFFVLDDKGTLLEHPYHPELIGKNVINLKDVEGKKFIAEFLKVAKEKGSGYVKYFWPKPGEKTPQPKFSYVVYFKPFKWIIGTGLYPSEYIEEFKSFAQKQALELLKHMRYGKGKTGYFWVMDETGKLLMHPISPELVGKPNKVSTMILKKIKNRSSVFVIYKWPKPGESTPKLKMSYAIRFKLWNWIIGTGMYIEDIEKEKVALQYYLKNQVRTWMFRSIFTSIFIAIFTLIVLNYFFKNAIFKRLKILEKHLFNIAEGNLEIIPGPLEEDEISRIEKSVNQTIAFLKKIHSDLINILKSLREGNKLPFEAKGAKGEYKTILETLYNFYDELLKAIKILEEFAYSLEQGNLKEIIISDELPPVFIKILQRLEVARKNLLNILREIQTILIKIEEGNFDVEVKQKAEGVYKEILEGIEKILENFKNVLKEIKNISQEVLKGNLHIQIDENKFKGDYKQVIYYLNEIIFQLKEELKKREKLFEKERELLELRKLVEEDSTLEEIYNRIAHLIEKRFEIKQYAFYEVDQAPVRIILPFGSKEKYCKPEFFENPSLCRAARSGKEVKGFMHSWGTECEYFALKEKNYICVPFVFEEKTRYVLQVIINPEENLEKTFYQIKELCVYLDTILPILEVKKLLKNLEERSVKDGLTGLYNRHFLNEYIIKASELALRHGHSIGILMIDIDFFKKVNDQFGHDVGDIVLKQIAEILKSRFRKADVIVRYGGEEFLVLLHNVDENKLIEIAEQIRIAVENTPFQTPQGPIKKTISIGVAVYPIDSKDIWQVIKFADIALYHAKKTGRNKVIRFTKDLIQ